MSESMSLRRRKVYLEKKRQFPSSPIRLISMVDQTMRQTFPDYRGIAVAIGDIDETGFPEGLAARLAALKDLRRLERIKRSLTERENARLECYNLTGSGCQSLRKGWANLFARETGVSYDPTDGAMEIFVTHGGMQAIFNALIASCRELGWTSRVRPGGRPRLFVHAPTFPCVGSQANLLGIDLVVGDCRPEDHFLLNAEDFAKRPEWESDVYYIMTTSNPTSLRPEPDPASPLSLKRVIEAVLAVNPEASIILDIVYNRTLPGDANRRMLDFLEDHPAGKNVIFIESLSKTHAFTGVRSGAVLTKSPVSKWLNDLGLDSMAGPSNVMQWRAASVLEPYWDESLGEEGIDASRDFTQALAAHMGARRRRLLSMIFADPLLSGWFLPPAGQTRLALPYGTDWQGGLYAWLALDPEKTDALRSSDKSDILPEERTNPALHLFFEAGMACVGGVGFVTSPWESDDSREARGAAIEEASNYIRLSVGMMGEDELG